MDRTARVTAKATNCSSRKTPKSISDTSDLSPTCQIITDNFCQTAMSETFKAPNWTCYVSPTALNFILLPSLVSEVQVSCYAYTAHLDPASRWNMISPPSIYASPSYTKLTYTPKFTMFSFSRPLHMLFPHLQWFSPLSHTLIPPPGLSEVSFT